MVEETFACHCKGSNDKHADQPDHDRQEDRYGFSQGGTTDKAVAHHSVVHHGDRITPSFQAGVHDSGQ